MLETQYIQEKEHLTSERVILNEEVVQGCRACSPQCEWLVAGDLFLNGTSIQTNPAALPVPVDLQGAGFSVPAATHLSGWWCWCKSRAAWGTGLVNLPMGQWGRQGTSHRG